MGFFIVICGKSSCRFFSQAVIIGDHLKKNLPDFQLTVIEKNILEWDKYLEILNNKNNWHHRTSPLVWKELLNEGSHPYYIGDLPNFWDYCLSYYNLKLYISEKNFNDIVENIQQFKNKMKIDVHNNMINTCIVSNFDSNIHKVMNRNRVITVYGSQSPIIFHLISELADCHLDRKNICKVFIYNHDKQQNLPEVAHDFDFIDRNNTIPVDNVKIISIEQLGSALLDSDLLIVCDFVPYRNEDAMEKWLLENKNKMIYLAYLINASAQPKKGIIFANLGPACYNATILKRELNKQNVEIVVATSDLGLKTAPILAEISEIPINEMFCPPVWGFVGINHLVDVNSTVHKYNFIEPYKRYVNVKNSTLQIGSLVPELRTLEYLIREDELLWRRVVERQCFNINVVSNRAEAVITIIKQWLFERDPEAIITLGVQCNGSFGIKFDGIFSQPARLVNMKWVPASDYLTPKDRYVKLAHLDHIAQLVMDFPEKIPK